MNCDRAYCIGSAHDVCQDYAIANNDDVPYIILSDGCSGSPNTDFGARILVASANEVLATDKTMGMVGTAFYKTTAHVAQLHARILALPPSCIDATLLIASVIEFSLEGNKYTELKIGIYGDGAIAVKMKSGVIYLHFVVYECGFPSYPSYLLDESRRQSWKAHIGCVHTQPALQTVRIEPDGTCITIKADITEEYKDWSVIYGNFERQFVRNSGGFDDIEFVALMSDGVESFYEVIETGSSKQHHSIDKVEIVKELLAFKNYNGVFVRRRMHRFLKDCQKRNWHHSDDVSLAVLYVGD